MTEWLTQFHFLRPLWLLAIVPLSLLVWLLFNRQHRKANWHGAIDQSLLPYLSDGVITSASRLPYAGLWLAMTLACIALAGPTWKKLPQPVYQRQDALVIVLDLSLSMLAEDVKPSRLARARHKILDVLQLRREGLTGLVAYSGDAHVVTPLTDDTPTIANLVPSLSPLMMPVYGSDPVDALQLAESLFSSAGVSEGHILLVTDGITARDLDELDDSLRQQGIGLSILGVGTAEGAPIPADRGYLKDESGNIIIPQLDNALLEQLAAANSGRYTTVAIDERDLRFLLPPVNTSGSATIASERDFDQWIDRGPWLALLLIPLVALSFRRGWILSLCLPLLLLPQPSQALEWQDLWQRPDQRGAAMLNDGDADEAAKTFRDPAWKGSALYRAEDYEGAAQQFSSLDSADGHFNRGNALARSGQLQQAIDAYNQALQQNPSMEDARFNRDLVQQLLDQQQSDQQPSADNQDQGEQDNNQNQDQQQNGQQSQQQNGQQGGEQDNTSSSQSSQGDNTNPSSTADNTSAEQQDETQTGEQDQAAADEAQSDTAEAQEQNPAQADKAQQQRDDQDTEQAQQQTAADASESTQSEQQRQATEQWLRQIPDDPAGLLRRKFHYESQRRQQNDTTREQPRW